MWKNRNCQQCVCLTSARPQCTGPQCSTCKVCRDPDCPKGKKCQRQVTELHHKQRPTSFQEVQAYLCSKCKPITCRCGKQLPKKMQKKALQEARQYICPDCQTKDLRDRDRKRKVFQGAHLRIFYTTCKCLMVLATESGYERYGTYISALYVGNKFI